MSLVTEFGVPAESFPLAHTMNAVPGAEIRADRLATLSREWVMPIVTISAPGIGAVEPSSRPILPWRTHSFSTRPPTLGRSRFTGTRLSSSSST